MDSRRLTLSNLDWPNDAWDEACHGCRHFVVTSRGYGQCEVKAYPQQSRDCKSWFPNLKKPKDAWAVGTPSTGRIELLGWQNDE